MATIKDVAKRAGVAVSTASYALNGVTKVSSTTKKKVLEAAKELNYQKNGLAYDLKKTKSNTIALILSDLSGPYYSELIKGVQEVAMTNNFGLVACSSIGGSASTALKFLKEKRVDGAIVLAHNISDDIILQSARESFPIVLLDRQLDSEHTIHVVVDNKNGGFMATEHLIRNGHCDIAYISGPYDSHDNEMRFAGYKQALDTYGIDYQSRWKITGGFTREGGYRATKILIAQGNMPSSVFYGNDEMAIGGLQAFTESGINIPDDISVIGFDDILESRYVSLSTIKQPKYEAGVLAVHLILQIFDHEQIKQNFQLSTELVERGTVKNMKLSLK